MYWDDRYGTETVSHEVLGRMKQLMVDNNTAASHSFLLDDDSSIPFSLDDISNLMEDKVKLSLCFYCFFDMLLSSKCTEHLQSFACPNAALVKRGTHSMPRHGCQPEMVSALVSMQLICG